MSYPAARYHGDSGEVSATYRHAQAPHDLGYSSGVQVDYLATSESTNGEFGLYRWNFGPDKGGPGPHFHRTISESFFVLTGTVRLYNGADWIEATSGDYLYVPPGGIHAFENVPGEPASMLLLFAPGAPREGYFEGLAKIREGKQMSAEELAAFYAYHDNIWIEQD